MPARNLDDIKAEMLKKVGEIEARQAKGEVNPRIAQMLKWEDDWNQRREQKRLEREQRREQRRRRDRAHFGEETRGASSRHREAQCDEKRLREAGLPVLRSEEELAGWLGISLGRLRWFTHDKPADSTWHYVRFTIPKRTGGERVILAPKLELKALQRQVLHGVLEKVSPSGQAHGFVTERSIVTNARPHVGHAFTLNIDLQDFFPSITFPRVRGLFISLGYSFSVASTLALLCTEHEREVFQSDDQRFYVSIGDRYLVQGAPTSPAIANLAARQLDRRLAGLADKHHFVYTRYADDLTFSGDDRDSALRILDVAARIISDEDFKVHPHKTHLYPRSARQMVTGVVVNDRLNTPRELRRRVRAILHQAHKSGLEAQNTEERANFRAYINGLIAYINESNPDVAQQLWKELHTLPD